MQKTVKALGLLVIAVLFLSISSEFFQLGYVTATTDTIVGSSLMLDYGEYELITHKLSTAELQAYQNGASTNQENQTINHLSGEYGTGLTAPTNSSWSSIAENGYIVEAITNQTTLPAAIDLSLSQYFPPIGDQGSQGSCSSFAIGYYCKTYQEAKEHNWNLTDAKWTGGENDGNLSAEYQSKIMSPAFVYNLINDGVDAGSDFETPIRLASNVGICSWEKMPYYWQDCLRWPTEAAWAEAPQYRANSTYSYQYLYANNTNGVESLKSWLAAGNLAIIAIDASDNLWNFTTHTIALSSQDLITNDTYTAGGLDHAATIVGYDDLYTYMENATVQHGAFKIANTWGKGSWENIPDGCYWITYAALQRMSTSENPAVLFQDLTDYQPEILTSFQITHPSRGNCSITFGLGTPDAPIITKNFTSYISGGNHSFCPNNIIFDLTDFSNYLNGLYNQPFYMQVYDKEPNAYGEATTGNVTYFAVANTISPQTPIETINGQCINLTLAHSFTQASFNLSPTSGPASGEVTISGIGLSANSVNISYYNPLTYQWLPIATDYAVSTNFSLSIPAPDLKQNNPEGDNTPESDFIIFRVQDDSNTFNASYQEWRRGLTQVSTQTAQGIFGNNTDLSGAVQVRNGESIALTGQWFTPGPVTVFWDNAALYTITANEDGYFATALTVPASSAGQHTLTVNDGTSNITVTLTYLKPQSNQTSESKSTATPTPTTSPIPHVPEYNTQLLIILFALITTLIMITLKTGKPQVNRLMR